MILKIKNPKNLLPPIFEEFKHKQNNFKFIIFKGYSFVKRVPKEYPKEYLFLITC